MKEMLLIFLVAVVSLELAVSVVRIRDEIMSFEYAQYMDRLERNVGL